MNNLFTEVTSKCDIITYNHVYSKQEIIEKCMQARKFELRSIFVSPSMINVAQKALEGSSVLIGTCIGYPFGSDSSSTKCAAIKYCIDEGVDEIDFFANISMLKSNERVYFYEELRKIIELVNNQVDINMLIDTKQMNDDEKLTASELSYKAGARIIKVVCDGVSISDIALIRRSLNSYIKVNSAGNISTVNDIIAMLEAGAQSVSLYDLDFINK